MFPENEGISSLLFLRGLIFVKSTGWKPMHIDGPASLGSAVTHECKGLSSSCWKVSTQNLPGKWKY